MSVVDKTLPAGAPMLGTRAVSGNTSRCNTRQSITVMCAVYAGARGSANARDQYYRSRSTYTYIYSSPCRALHALHAPQTLRCWVRGITEC